MTDSQILALFWDRNEDAIREADRAYGRKLYVLSDRILHSHQDAEESVSDTYMKTWETIPPQRPVYFFAYLAKLCRNFSLARIQWQSAAKRSAEIVTLTREMEECIPDRSYERKLEGEEIGRMLNTFFGEHIPGEPLDFPAPVLVCRLHRRNCSQIPHFPEQGQDPAPQDEKKAPAFSGKGGDHGMNGKDLFEGISHIDERYIEEAETKAFPRKYWTNAAALAACLCFILFSLYSMWNPIATEGNIAQDESTHPAGGIGPMEGEAIPEDSPITEVPSVILYVEEPTEYGWIGTVCELVDTDIFEVGMELNVVMTETIWQEDGDGNSLVVEQKRPDYSGCYVMVQFIHYDPETNTITVNLIREVQPPESTP